MNGRSAKILLSNHEGRLISIARSHRNPVRDRVIIMLSFKAGLRACEIAGLTWSMVTDGRGRVAHHIDISGRIAKYGSARRIPMHKDLRRALFALAKLGVTAEGPVVRSERGGRMTAKSVVNWFTRLYREAGLEGCSSHSGRRTFVTRAARLVGKAGGSLRDVQQLVGHRSITTTQRYIDGDSDAQRKLVQWL